MAIKRLSLEDKTMFTLQWHLTTDCPNQCRHCYVERNNKTLSLNDCKKIVDSFKSLLEKWNCRGRINFSGGDPLMYPHFFELLRYTCSQIPNLRIGILGNPELLTEEIIEKLKQLRLYSYQVSIDGLKKTHDYFRYDGSFEETIKKIRFLKKKGVRTVVMTTVSKRNIEEVPHIIDLIVKEKVDVFGFKRFVPIGKGEEIKKEALIAPNEFRDLLLKADRKQKKYKNCGTFFSHGEPLWKLFELEIGDFSLSDYEENNDLIWGGCGIGICALTILENGDVLSCRRLPIIIGKVPDQSIRDIFISSKKLNELRKTEKLEKCKNCKLLPFCRGCRAVAHAVSGSYFASDPQCWKEKPILKGEKHGKIRSKNIEEVCCVAS